MTAGASDDRAWNVWHVSADVQYHRDAWILYGEVDWTDRSLNLVLHVTF